MHMMYELALLYDVRVVLLCAYYSRVWIPGGHYSTQLNYPYSRELDMHTLATTSLLEYSLVEYA